MKVWLERLQRRLKPTRGPVGHGVIICGIEAVHYRLQQQLVASSGLRLEALVSDAPWQHATRIAGVRVFYPSEIPALIERTGARALIYCREADLTMFDTASRRSLDHQPVQLIALDPDRVADPAAWLADLLAGKESKGTSQ
ncbi:hypothetical protein [Kushneria phosphatilytica]|uniref:Uncharacterized protein n=1 Tax=Kushneria phosphatilytica TaxID=657387 RepID=A0A1S1NTW6_9GAMM|nr:hypothetical protein [Kushneria phosphatilytica]OHV10581.1 hypothetical protein BH688_09360 [Kushneria phosphatilytica]QEL11841.1 hypothetical protein FY550_12310 [Kushneria phosphatilytica]